MGKALRASVLLLVLACSAQAGHIHNDVVGTPPKPPQSAAQEEQTADGDEPDGLIETLLAALGSVLALL